MVYFEDTGSVIEAPIEFIWEYLTSEHHGPAHAATGRNFKLREIIGATALVSAERLLDGRWSPFLTKSTDLPPLGIQNEEVEGEFAGTKFVLIYKPDGTRTRVDVYGDLRSNVYPLEVAREKYLRLLAGAYAEDVAAIRALKAK